MATEKQIAANRLNAQKSTGPRTAEGKSIAARNALRDGLLASTVVLEGESQTRFLEILNAFIAEVQPNTASEMMLVENMAVCRWRQMRIWGFEKAVIALEVARQEAELKDATPSAGQNIETARAFHSLGEKSRALDLMQRCETAYSRQFARCVDRIKQGRSRQAQQLPSPLKKPANAQNPHNQGS
jgi:hypothetical protein